jgi:hypothetical protein
MATPGLGFAAIEDPTSAAMAKPFLSLIGMMALVAGMYLSRDFSPSWPYLGVIAIAMPFIFRHAKSVLSEWRETATTGILATGNPTTLVVLATFVAVCALAMPVGKLLTYGTGTATHPAGMPIQHHQQLSRRVGFCRNQTLVKVEDGGEYWACGTMPLARAPIAVINLHESFFGYYASLRQ